jgi:hypothetical protein
MTLRTWKEWTKEERDEYITCFDDDNSAYGDVAKLSLEIAQRPAPRREIVKGTLVFVGQNEKWAEYPEWYVEKDAEGHVCRGQRMKESWRYARPVPPGWKPGDPLDPPNEGDL